MYLIRIGEKLEKQEYLTLNTSFYLPAKAKCDIKLIIRKLTKLKLLKKLVPNSITRYEIIKQPKSRSKCVLELSNDHLSLIFFYEKSDQSIYNSNLITLLSLIPLLNEFYFIEFDNIYPYIIEAIGQSWRNTEKDQSTVIKALKDRAVGINDSNCKLSNQIIELSRANECLSADVSIYKEFCNDILNISKGIEYGIEAKKDYIFLTQIGINIEKIQQVERRIMYSKE